MHLLTAFLLGLITATTAVTSLDDAAYGECQRYCQLSYTEGKPQASCLALCNGCRQYGLYGQQKPFQLGVDAKCDKKALVCMQLAGSMFAKLQSCSPRDACAQKHETCATPPAAPAPEPVVVEEVAEEDTERPPSTREMNKFAEDGCIKTCMSRPHSKEKRCTRICQCEAVTFELYAVKRCDQEALACMKSVGPQEAPYSFTGVNAEPAPKFECEDARKRCSKRHAVCVKKDREGKNDEKE